MPQHIEDAWVALDAYFQGHPYHITQHHLSSYDYFVQHGLAEAIRSMTEMVMIKTDPQTGRQSKVVMKVGETGLYLDKPTVADPDGTIRPLLPNEARLKDMTYAANLYADIDVHYEADGKPLGVQRFEAQRVGQIPIMLHSSMCLLHGMPPEVLHEMGECRNDKGGYFIVGGKEKVLVSRERAVYNRLFISKGGSGADKDDVAFEGTIRCLPPAGRGVFTRTVALQVRAADAPSRPGCLTVTLKRGLTRGSKPAPVPLFVLFRALGVESDRRILEFVLGDLDEPGNAALVDFLRPSLLDAKAVFSQRAALDELSPLTPYGNAESLKHVLMGDLFPNLGDDLTRKAFYLGYMARQMVVAATGSAPLPDRDSMTHKRVDLSGTLLANLFRDVYRRLREHALNTLDSEFLYGPWKNSGVLTSLVNAGNVRRIFRHDILTDGMMRSMRGSWGDAGEAKPGKESSGAGMDGVVQDLSRTSYLTYLAHVRRINNPIDRGVKMAEPHKLIGSQWGIVCPVDSPDGPNVGLLKHMAMLSSMTLGGAGDYTAPLVAALTEAGLVEDHAAYEWRPAALAGRCRVLVDGNWVGVALDPPALVAALRAMRRARAGPLPADASIAWDVFGNEVRVCADAGRCRRPLVRIDPKTREAALPAFLRARAAEGAPPPTWAELTEGEGAPLEVLDVEECATLLLALQPADAAAHPLLRYSHCELHPGTMFSAVASMMPFLNHNNAAYNSLCIAQFKQAVGLYVTSFNSRADVAGYILHSPQRPLVSTAWADRIDPALAHGENLIVAIAMYSGYNMEDAVILNLDSVRRGAFNMTCFHTVKFEEKAGGGSGGGGGGGGDESGGERLMFANPITLEAEGKNVTGVTFGRYDRIDRDGFPVPGSVIEEGDILAGMAHVQLLPPAEAAAAEAAGAGADAAAGAVVVEAVRIARDTKRVQVYRDRSQRADRGDIGIVDRVFVYRREDDPSLRCCKVRMRQVRQPELGDKVASRFGQKGVVGMLLPHVDMPFCHSSGMVPDLILNPNGFPKRMTVSHMLECVLAKAAAVGGRRYNGTTFEPDDVVGEAARVLGAAGMHRAGDEVMYNGRTGEQIQCSILVSPNYYGRLKHMVADKLNYRGGGTSAPVNAITRQPTKGHGEHGGLRIGEMEQHALLSHGMASFIKESFLDRSDIHRMYLDVEQGIPVAAADPIAGSFRSIDRGDPADAAPRSVADVDVPFAFKLMHQELGAMGIDARFLTDYPGDLDEGDLEGDLEGGEGEGGEGEGSEGEGSEGGDSGVDDAGPGAAEE